MPGFVSDEPINIGGLQAARGCTEELKISLNLPFAPDIKRCPQVEFAGPPIYWVKAYLRYNRFQVLPFPGGWDNQPAMVLEAFEQARQGIAEGHELAAQAAKRAGPKGG